MPNSDESDNGREEQESELQIENKKNKLDKPIQGLEKQNREIHKNKNKVKKKVNANEVHEAKEGKKSLKKSRMKMEGLEKKQDKRKNNINNNNISFNDEISAGKPEQDPGYFNLHECKKNKSKKDKSKLISRDSKNEIRYKSNASAGTKKQNKDFSENKNHQLRKKSNKEKNYSNQKRKKDIFLSEKSLNIDKKGSINEFRFNKSSTYNKKVLNTTNAYYSREKLALNSSSRRFKLANKTKKKNNNNPSNQDYQSNKSCINSKTPKTNYINPNQNFKKVQPLNQNGNVKQFFKSPNALISDKICLKQLSSEYLKDVNTGKHISEKIKKIKVQDFMIKNKSSNDFKINCCHNSSIATI